MDILASITGSRVRADVLAVLFGARARAWMPSDVGRAARQPRQLVLRELKRLVSAGVIRVRVADGQRSYEADPEGPVARELSRLVRQTRGRLPKMRHALVALRSPTLAWIIAAPVKGRPARKKLDLLVLTGAPKSLVRVQLADLLDGGTDLSCLSVREWVARLEKRDVFLRHARRARKLWVLGSWETLMMRERTELESKRLLGFSIANWREELSDEWDEDWDPFAPVQGSA